VFDALGEYATMRAGTGNKVIGIGFTGVRHQTVATFGILWLPGSAEIRNCEFWNNAKAIGITGTSKTTSVHIESTKFDLACNDALCSGSVGIDFLRSSSYDAVVDAALITFTGDGKGTGIKLSLGTMRIHGLHASGLGTAIDGGASSYGSFELEVTNGHFTSNGRAFYTYGYDPRLYKYTGRARFESCTFVRNVCASCNGPAIQAGQRITVAVGSSTFEANTAGGDDGSKSGRGGAIYCDDLASVSVERSSFMNNEAVDGSPGWCNAHCGFLANNVQLRDNTQEKDTGKCNWAVGELE